MRLDNEHPGQSIRHPEYQRKITASARAKNSLKPPAIGLDRTIGAMQCMRCMATKPISLRVPARVKLELESIAHRFGTTPATLGADFVTQGVRTARHPVIEFRQTPAGRMAYLRGVRLPVWLAVETVEDCSGNTNKAARLLRLPLLLLKAALVYAKEFPTEIAADRQLGHRPLGDLDTLVPNHSFLRV